MTERTEMTKEELLAEFRVADQDRLTIEDKVFNEHIRIVQEEINFGLPEYIYFKNCVFKGRLFFSGVTINCGIEFLDCRLESRLEFLQCDIVENDGVRKYAKSQFTITNTFIYSFFVNSLSIRFKGLRIENGSQINKLFFHNLSFENGGSLEIDSSSVRDIFDIDVLRANVGSTGSEIAGGIKILNCEQFTAKVRINRLKEGGFYSENTTFTSDLFLDFGKYDTLNFIQSECKGSVSINEVSVNNLFLYESAFNKPVTQKTKGQLFPKKVTIHSCSFHDGLELDGENIGDTFMDSLEIKATNRLQGSINIRNYYIDITKLTGLNVNSIITFNECKFKTLTFNQFQNQGAVSFNPLTASGTNSEITIQNNSNLGVTSISNVDLNDFNLTITDSRLTDMQFFNVKWMGDEKLNAGKDNRHQKNREVFRQLKHAVEKQSDRISALELKASEFKSYEKALNKEAKWYEKAQVWAMKTNDFGQNWFKPVRLLLVITVIYHFSMFSVLICVPGDGKIIPDNTDYGSALEMLPALLDPTSFPEDVFKDYDAKLKFGVFSKFIGYLYQIILAFFIFQTISAFRKYVK